MTDTSNLAGYPFVSQYEGNWKAKPKWAYATNEEVQQYAAREYKRSGEQDKDYAQYVYVGAAILWLFFLPKYRVDLFVAAGGCAAGYLYIGRND